MVGILGNSYLIATTLNFLTLKQPNQVLINIILVQILLKYRVRQSSSCSGAKPLFVLPVCLTSKHDVAALHIPLLKLLY
jgi:hypothetical protein